MAIFAIPSDHPAISEYENIKPKLLSWFDKYSGGRSMTLVLYGDDKESAVHLDLWSRLVASNPKDLTVPTIYIICEDPKIWKDFPSTSLPHVIEKGTVSRLNVY